MDKPGKPIRPSAALRTAYQKALTKAVDEMHKSVQFWTRAAYRKQGKRMALDASPAAELRRAMRKFARRWQAKFDGLAPDLADYFAKAASSRVDRELAAMLRDAGWTVNFKLTARQRNTLQAVVGENVTLIKSIPEKYLADVEQRVMQSVATGRDLATVTKELESAYGITRRRAALVARTQNQMATSTLARSRQLDAGITKARWLHSAGGKTPRPEHVAFSGKVYEIEKGAFLEGKWTWPGLEINCKCVPVPLIPGYEPPGVATR